MVNELLEDLEDSELTTATLFRRSVRKAQFVAKHKGRITRYVYDEAIDREFAKLPEAVQREYDRLTKEGK